MGTRKSRQLGVVAMVTSLRIIFSFPFAKSSPNESSVDNKNKKDTCQISDPIIKCRLFGFFFLVHFPTTHLQVNVISFEVESSRRVSATNSISGKREEEQLSKQHESVFTDKKLLLHSLMCRVTKIFLD